FSGCQNSYSTFADSSEAYYDHFFTSIEEDRLLKAELNRLLENSSLLPVDTSLTSAQEKPSIDEVTGRNSEQTAYENAGPYVVSATNTEEQRVSDLRESIVQQRDLYRTAFVELRALRPRIEHAQHCLETAKMDLVRGFETWWAKQTGIAEELIHPTSCTDSNSENHQFSTATPLEPSLSHSFLPISSSPRRAPLSLSATHSSFSPRQTRHLHSDQKDRPPTSEVKEHSN
ncbi:unnamed protein product, partial [Protopolystoma xenopodis]